MQYEVGHYNQRRWAVCHAPTGVWYFSKRYGQAAAHALARRLNAEAT